MAINAQSASWTYNYRQRGVDYYGKRHPQKTIKVVHPVTMTPQEARFRVEEIKAEVRAGGDPIHTIEQVKFKVEQADFKGINLTSHPAIVVIFGFLTYLMGCGIASYHGTLESMEYYEKKALSKVTSKFTGKKERQNSSETGL